jgi:predicted acyltransferase
VSERPAVAGRLLSLDAFRGATIAAMILVNNPGDWGHVYWPLLHAEWHGWTFTSPDTAPFFEFLAGQKNASLM